MECDYDIVGTKDGGYVQEIGKSDDGKYIYIFSFSVVLDSADLKRSPSHNLPVEKERRYKFLNNDYDTHITLEKHENGWVRVGND